MFNPGDLVMLNAEALTANIRMNGRIFPDLTDTSVLRVKYQRGYAVYIDTGSSYHGVINEQWLRLAPTTETSEAQDSLSPLRDVQPPSPDAPEEITQETVPSV